MTKRYNYYLYALHLLALISSTHSSRYISPECSQWPKAEVWQKELGTLLSQNARLHGPIDPESFFDECTGSDPFVISQAGNGICMHLFACAYEFCRPDAEEENSEAPPLNLPAYIVEPKTPNDISTAIRFAKRHKIPVSVKTSGHSYQGSSTAANSLLIWMKNYPKDGTITHNYRDSCGTSTAAVVGIGGGEVWDDVLAAVSDGHAIASGSGRTVSAAGGWLQGVGLSFAARAYGAGIDNVADLRVVLPDARHVRADPCTNPHLFWALRGGGGGTYGVVTHVHYKLHPKTTVVVLNWNLRTEGPTEDSHFQFARVWLAYWIKVSPALDDRWSGFYHAFGVYLVFVGSPEDADTTFVNNFEKWYFSTFGIFSDIANPRSTIEVFPSWFDYQGGQEAVGNPDFAIPTGDDHEGVEFLGARLMPRSLVEEKPQEVLDFLLDLLAIDYSYVNHYLGGRISAVDGGATAVHPAMRSAIWAVFWTSDEAAKVVRDFLPNNITGASFNHHQTSEPDWTESLWGSNYDRLLELKNKYDPDRVFNCWHCVGYSGREFSEPIDNNNTCPPVVTFACFASDMTVQVLRNRDDNKDAEHSPTGESNAVMKKMKDLRVGDKVLVNHLDLYETIYDFGHYEPALKSTYLELHPSGLKLSKDHMVFVKGKQAPVPASIVKVGDFLLIENGRFQAVTSIETVVQEGAYAPFTSSGTIVVNGIQASTFISFQESDTLVIGGLSTGLTFQWMARTFELPHKWLCGNGTCASYAEGGGMSPWVSASLGFAQWWLNDNTNAMLIGLVTLPVVSLLFALAAVEWITRNLSVGLILGGSITVVLLLILRFKNRVIIRSSSNNNNSHKRV